MKEYVSVAQFAEIRDVSTSTVKRRIKDGTIKKTRQVPGPFDQDKYMIHRSELAIAQKDLFGNKRPPLSKVNNEKLETEDMMSESDLLSDVRYLRKVIDIAGKRLEAVEMVLAHQSK